jgi:hypothetical protein
MPLLSVEGHKNLLRKAFETDPWLYKPLSNVVADEENFLALIALGTLHSGEYVGVSGLTSETTGKYSRVAAAKSLEATSVGFLVRVIENGSRRPIYNDAGFFLQQLRTPFSSSSSSSSKSRALEMPRLDRPASMMPSLVGDCKKAEYFVIDYSAISACVTQELQIAIIETLGRSVTRRFNVQASRSGRNSMNNPKSGSKSPPMKTSSMKAGPFPHVNSSYTRSRRDPVAVKSGHSTAENSVEMNTRSLRQHTRDLSEKDRQHAAHVKNMKAKVESTNRMMALVRSKLSAEELHVAEMEAQISEMKKKHRADVHELRRALKEAQVKGKRDLENAHKEHDTQRESNLRAIERIHLDLKATSADNNAIHRQNANAMDELSSLSSQLTQMKEAKAMMQAKRFGDLVKLKLSEKRRQSVKASLNSKEKTMELAVKQISQSERELQRKLTNLQRQTEEKDTRMAFKEREFKSKIMTQNREIVEHKSDFGKLNTVVKLVATQRLVNSFRTKKNFRYVLQTMESLLISMHEKYPDVYEDYLSFQQLRGRVRGIKDRLDKRKASTVAVSEMLGHLLNDVVGVVDSALDHWADQKRKRDTFFQSNVKLGMANRQLAETLRKSDAYIGKINQEAAKKNEECIALKKELKEAKSKTWRDKANLTRTEKDIVKRETVLNELDATIRVKKRVCATLESQMKEVIGSKRKLLEETHAMGLYYEEHVRKAEKQDELEAQFAKEQMQEAARRAEQKASRPKTTDGKKQATVARGGGAGRPGKRASTARSGAYSRHTMGMYTSNPRSVRAAPAAATAVHNAKQRPHKPNSARGAHHTDNNSNVRAIDLKHLTKPLEKFLASQEQRRRTYGAVPVLYPDVHIEKAPVPQDWDAESLTNETRQRTTPLFTMHGRIACGKGETIEAQFASNRKVTDMTYRVKMPGVRGPVGHSRRSLVRHRQKEKRKQIIRAAVAAGERLPRRRGSKKTAAAALPISNHEDM